MTSPPPQGATAALQSQQNLILIRVYGWYRVVLSLLLLLVLVSSGGKPIVGRYDPDLFGWLCAGYFALSILLLLLVSRHRPLHVQQLFAVFCVDIAVLIALSHVSGGIRSGLAPLLLVVVASAGMMLRGQLALLVAALATISLLADTFYLISVGRDATDSLLPCATLGVLAFATSIAFQYLSQRLRTTQLLAQQRAADVSKLQYLNHLIVQRMRTGILVIDNLCRIKMMNRSAAELLHAETLQRQLEQGVHPPLAQRLQTRLLDWQQNPFASNPPFVVNGGPELIARFTRLDDDTGDTLIFLEDSSQIAQRAQQLKLAALGRLTASIAHEIRNPLGAVSHAAQLLQESSALADGDRRLADIVHNHARRMNGVIENVLQLSRRSPPNPQRLRLGEWLHDFVDDYLQGSRPDAPAPEITIAERAPTEVTCDADQLGQVLTNLLDNALRHSEKQSGRATARLVVRAAPNRLPQLDVIDDGPGIPDSEQEKVFEPFFTTEATGNGLGLYIARELCEINQAHLNYLRSREGKSCFRISFSHPNRRPLINE